MNDGLLVEDVAEIDIGKLLTPAEAWEARFLVWYRDYPSAPRSYTRSLFIPPVWGVDARGYKIVIREPQKGDLPYPPSGEKYYYTGETVTFPVTDYLGLPMAIRSAAVSRNGVAPFVETWADENDGKGLTQILSGGTATSGYLRDQILRYYDPATFSNFSEYEGRFAAVYIPAQMSAHKKDERSITALVWMLRYLDLPDVAADLEDAIGMIYKYLKPLPPIPKSELNWQQDWLESAKKYAKWYRHNIVQAEVRVGIDALISICNSFSASDLMEIKYNAQQKEKYIG